MKHLARNSFSSCRACWEATFLIIFFRLVRPRFENLRMFSRFLWRFSFLALTRHASSSVVDETADRPRKGAGAKAYMYT